MNIVVPQPQYWGDLHWLWMNVLYDFDSLSERMYRVNGVWYEFVAPVEPKPLSPRKEQIRLKREAKS